VNYIDAKIATAEDVKTAHKAGVALAPEAEADEFDPLGWRLRVLFRFKGDTWVYMGRMFRAPNQSAAGLRVIHQLKRLLGGSDRIAGKLSAEYIEARSSLELKIETLWTARKDGEPNLIKPGKIKVDWNHGEPLLRVYIFTNAQDLQRKYDPEYSRFVSVVRTELATRNVEER
jgi:hypothetical protein